MKTNTISLVLAITGGILAVGNTITSLPLPGWLTQAWPIVLVLATVVDRAAKNLSGK